LGLSLAIKPNEEIMKINRIFRVVDRSRLYLAWAMILFIPTTLSASDAVLGYEFVGQVLNVSASQSLQYGYLNSVSGLETVAIGSSVSENTALLSFYNDTTTQQVINNGPIRIIDRTGTSTIYFNTSGGGDFNNPDSFRSGKPIQACRLRHQVVIDTSAGYFTATFEMTVQSARSFQINGKAYRLDVRGKTYRWSVYGKLTQQGPPSAQIAGFASGIRAELVEQED
jgi:hypothetical protein